MNDLVFDRNGSDADLRNRLIDAFAGTRGSGCFDPALRHQCAPHPIPMDSRTERRYEEGSLHQAALSPSKTPNAAFPAKYRSFRKNY